jgi:hypothetical protein
VRILANSPKSTELKKKLFSFFKYLFDTKIKF